MGASHPQKRALLLVRLCYCQWTEYSHQPVLRPSETMLSEKEYAAMHMTKSERLTVVRHRGSQAGVDNEKTAPHRKFLCHCHCHGRKGRCYSINQTHSTCPSKIPTPRDRNDAHEGAIIAGRLTAILSITNSQRAPCPNRLVSVNNTRSGGERQGTPPQYQSWETDKSD